MHARLKEFLIFNIINWGYANQQAYYDPITASTDAGQSGPFIDFMLNEIYNTLKEHQGEELPTNDANPIDRQFGIKFGKSDKQLLLLIDGKPMITASDAAE